MKISLMLLPIVCFAGAAASKPLGEIGYPNGSLGYDALVEANYKVAEQQILADDSTSKNDPAKLINLGQIYWKTGRVDMAVRVLETALRSEDVEIILANGDVMSSREAARKTLSSIRK